MFRVEVEGTLVRAESTESHNFCALWAAQGCITLHKNRDYVILKSRAEKKSWTKNGLRFQVPY